MEQVKQQYNTSQASCPLNKLVRILMAGAGSRPTRKGGQSWGGRAVVWRSRLGTRLRPTQCPPPPPPPPPLPPPPHPTTADNAAADVDANATAAALANINESPATRTRRRLMLAIQSGSNAAAGRRGRDDNVLDDSPARRTRQRLGQLDAASANTAGTSNAYMRRLFGAQTGAGSDKDSHFNNEDPYEEDDHSHKEERVVQVPAAAGGGQGTVGREEVQYGANRLTNVGRNWLLEKCVKEHVFPKIKFATLHGDLDFSNNPNSICRFMAEKMKVQEEDVEGWWETSKKTVHNKLKANQNNVIKGIKTRFHGKDDVMNDCVVIMPCFF